MREFSCAKGVSQIHHTLYSLYLDQAQEEAETKAKSQEILSLHHYSGG